ncbi:MAG: flagellar biosynthetic protein FliO [Gammaproteobacteria bacterium]|jgi:flagellar protein FliO/FliZ|nr:flagellar biosynthetic protein FliO [Gammaproteobacteria bacterium]
MDMSPLLSAVLSFVFVLGLLLATLWFVRTRGIGVGTMQGKNLRVVNSLRLGPKHRLDVVEYEGKRLLLGVAANQITLLDNQQLESASETAPADDAADPAAATQSAPGSFAGQLRRLMQPNKTP